MNKKRREMKRINFLLCLAMLFSIHLFAEDTAAGDESSNDDATAWIVADIQKKEAGDLTADILKIMDSSQVRAIKLEHIEGFEKEQVRALGVNKILNLKEGQVDVLVRKHAIEQIDGNTEPNLSDEQLVAVLNDSQILDQYKEKIQKYINKIKKMDDVTPSVIRQTTSKQIRAWTPPEIKKLEQDDLDTMHSWQIEELIENHTDNLTEEQKIWIISRTDLHLIIADIVENFSEDIMKKLTEQQLIGLGYEATNALIEHHLDDLEKEQVKVLYDSKMDEMTKENKAKIVGKYKELYSADETEKEE
jgi:hypothetical protein